MNNQDKKVIEVENAHHMGDNFINFMFLTQIKDFLENKGIYIKYYCWPQYHANLHDFNPSNNISIHSLQKPYKKKYYELWQGGHIGQITPIHIKKVVEDQLVFMFNKFLENYKFNIKVDNWIYENIKIKDWYNNLDTNLKDIDILIVNSSPKSGQYPYDKSLWDRYIQKLNSSCKIATTEFVSNEVISLHTYNLKDITAISINVKYIIAINTGPLLPLFNTYTLNNVKKIYIFGGNFKHCKTICNPQSIANCILDINNREDGFIFN